MQIKSQIAEFVRKALRKPAIRISKLFASNPDPEKVNKELEKLYNASIQQDQARNRTMTLRLGRKDNLVIFSDQHKGNGQGADEFILAEGNYTEALAYYNSRDFQYIDLGDSEELWKFEIEDVHKTHKPAFDQEKKFVARKALFKVFGNHDIFWNQGWAFNKNVKFPTEKSNHKFLEKIYGNAIPIYEAITVQIALSGEKEIKFFCAHGHQGDGQSDGNRLSVWFINNVWGPLQTFLRVNINTPANDTFLKSKHNTIMYEWSKKNPERILVTGHTHQPVFNSLTHQERLYLRLQQAEINRDHAAIDAIRKEIPRRRKDYDNINASFSDLLPTYFNTGCCCYSDGTITGIEIAEGYIRLVKWSYQNGQSVRIVAEEESLDNLWNKLHAALN